ncbi:hypothetical protein Tco_0305193 [Tanacetum coccineum]
MDLYHSRLTPDYLNDLIIKYKIPRDLYPRLPSEEFVLFELPDDAIGPLGLNKVITFEVLCRSLQIELTVTLFRVFQTLCKQGDWFSNTKRRAPSPDAMVWRHPDAAIDDPRPAAGSFNMADVCRLSVHVIKLRDIPKGILVLSGLSRVWKNHFCDLVLWVPMEMVWGVGCNCFALCPWLLLLAFIVVFLFAVMGIHDFLCLPEWIADAVIPNPTLEDLAAVTPSSKILAKAEASQKRKASTSGAASSHVAKRTRSTLAQSSGSTTRPSLFAGDDDASDDDDACVEIPLVTHLRSAAVIPSSGNQDSRGKGIMVDDVVAPSGGVSRKRPSSRPAPSFRDVSGDAIHTDFFPFSVDPYYATYPEDGVTGNCEFTREEWDAPYRPTFGVITKEVFKDPAICKTVVDQFPTPGEMVRVEGLSDDQLTTKMSVLHYMMMSHGGKILARYRGLNQSHHEYVLSTDSRLKGYEEKAAGLTGLELQVSTLKKQVSRLNDKLATSDASFSKSKAKGNERKKKIKSLSKSLDNFHSEVARLSAALNQTTILEAERDEERLAEASLLVAQTDYAFLNKISEYAIEPLSVILQLEPEKLVRLANVPIPRDTRVSPLIAKDSTMIPVSKSLELSANVVPASLAVALEQNEEQVSAAVDGSDLEITDGAARSKSRVVFVQGTSHVLDDVAEVTVVGSKRVSSGLTDVVVALSAGEKGDGYALSSTFEEVVVPLSKERGAWYVEEHLLLRAWGKLTVDVLLSIQRILSHAILPKPNGFLTGTCSIAGQASILLLDICYNYKSIQLLLLASWLQFGFAPSALLVTLPFLLLLVSSTDGLVLKPTDNSWLRNSLFIVARPVNTSAFRFKIFGRCVIRNLWNGTVASIISSLYLLSCSVAGVWFPST